MNLKSDSNRFSDYKFDFFYSVMLHFLRTVCVCVFITEHAHYSMIRQEAECRGLASSYSHGKWHDVIYVNSGDVVCACLFERKRTSVSA